MPTSSGRRLPSTAGSEWAILYRITADSFAVQTMIMNGALPILSAPVLLGGMLVVHFR
jgi:hypothetical protein